MHQSFGEAHRHLVRNHPIAYGVMVLALVAAVVLAVLGHATLALALFVAVGLSGLAMFRYEG